MNVTKYTTPTAAGAEVHARAERHMQMNGSSSYREATNAVLAADCELATAYAAPAARSRAPMRSPAPVPGQAPGKPVADAPGKPVAGDGGSQDAVLDLLAKAILDNQTDALPGALGELAAEARKLVAGGLRPELAPAYAKKAFPDLAEAAAKELDDMKAEAPALSQGAGALVHARASRLTEASRGVSYSEAVHRVLDADTALKRAYTGQQS